jgi:hypothetical protein
MKYKAFEDFYKESSIKHLVLHEHNGILISPPFSTDKCKDYNKILCIDGHKKWFIDLDITPATSKFNSVVSLNDSIWFIPYGIWDNFNIVVQLKNFKPIYHTIDFSGKGQFYSIASNKDSAFSFPLGYEDTSYGIYIKNETLKCIKFERKEHIKLHMGSVYANGKFWSAPRGDTPGYVDMVSFDGVSVERYPININNPNITRKYTDLIVKNNKLYSLPFGESKGLNEVLEFDTITNTYSLTKLNIPDFCKKFNVGVLLDDIIIGLPYGDEHYNDSNWGLVYNINTKEHHVFDIGLSFGGKYRFRSGINFNGNAVFMPTGTPTCPIMIIDKNGTILFKQLINDYLVSRPIIYRDEVVTLAYRLEDKTHHLLSIDFNFNLRFEEI